jgi:hypothetical protein
MTLYPKKKPQLQQSSRIQTQCIELSSFNNSEKTEKEFRKIIPFIIASKKKKNLGINLTKDVKDVYKENYRLLKKATEEDYRRWKDLPHP